MATPNKQFDPFVRGDQLVAEMDLHLQEFRAMFERSVFMMRAMREENERLAAQRDDLEVYTEQEAATLLRVGEGDTSHDTLAALRRQFRLPHMKFGNKVRYTKQQLAEICGMLEIRGKRKITNNEFRITKKAA